MIFINFVGISIRITMRYVISMPIISTGMNAKKTVLAKIERNELKRKREKGSDGDGESCQKRRAYRIRHPKY